MQPPPVRGGPSALLARAKRLLGARKMPVTALRFHDHGLEEFRLLFPLSGRGAGGKAPARLPGRGAAPGPAWQGWGKVAGPEQGLLG